MFALEATWTERMLALCSIDALAGSHAALIGGLGLAGLIGGALHCAPMCGPFVLAQGTRRAETPASRLHAIAGALLIPYHLGRTTTYAALGALSGGLGGTVLALSGVRWVAAALLLIAALFLVSQAMKSLGAPVPLPPRLRYGLGRLSLPLMRRAGRLGARSDGGLPAWRGYVLGLVLGFLPCGLLYGALFAAAASGSLVAGALVMAAFAAGTAPALGLLAATGHVAARRWPGALHRVSGIALGLGAALSAAFAVEWLS
jgi:sulfite exporter TauE/SafE